MLLRSNVQTFDRLKIGIFVLEMILPQLADYGLYEVVGW